MKKTGTGRIARISIEVTQGASTEKVLLAMHDTSPAMRIHTSQFNRE